MEAVVKTDDRDVGGIRKALSDKLIEVWEADSLYFPGTQRRHWRCRMCDKQQKEVGKNKDVYSEFQSHVVHQHDPSEDHSKDGIAGQTPAYFLFPVSTVKHRETKQKAQQMKAEKAQQKTQELAAFRTALPALPSPTLLSAAIDSLVGAGFTAKCEELEWLEDEVKKRIGKSPVAVDDGKTGAPVTPVKPQKRRRTSEAASLGDTASSELPPRGCDAYRSHARAAAGHGRNASGR